MTRGRGASIHPAPRCPPPTPALWSYNALVVVFRVPIALLRSDAKLRFRLDDPCEDARPHRVEPRPDGLRAGHDRGQLRLQRPDDLELFPDGCERRLDGRSVHLDLAFHERGEREQAREADGG